MSLELFLGFVLLIIPTCWILQGQAQDTDYCSFTPTHTLCQYQGPNEESCGDILGFGLDADQILEAVHFHNQFRSTIASGSETRGSPGPQPSGSNIKQMKWDWELARVAQLLAEQCRFEHDCADCRTVDRFLVGQNLYQTWENQKDATVNWEAAVRAWYDEVDIFNNSGTDYYEFEPATGHFTQLVWANTEYIGCGFTYYLRDNLYHKLYVCNYGPTGNYITEPLYKIGPPCSDCPENTECSRTYKGLCNRFENSEIISQGVINNISIPAINITSQSIVDNIIQRYAANYTEFNTYYTEPNKTIHYNETSELRFTEADPAHYSQTTELSFTEADPAHYTETSQLPSTEVVPEHYTVTMQLNSTEFDPVYYTETFKPSPTEADLMHYTEASEAGSTKVELHYNDTSLPDDNNPEFPQLIESQQSEVLKDYVFVLNSVSEIQLQFVLSSLRTILEENQTMFQESGLSFAENEIWAKLCDSKMI